MKFNCGCQFTNFDWEKVNLECPATWDMIGEGITKGVFQLEESLGKRWTKAIKPRNIREMSDVISLIRPGCLEAKFRELDSGKFLSITDTYLAIRDKKFEPEYIDESLRPIMENSYGVPIYQEQMMRICTDYAGFDMKEADNVRKACGKKDMEKMLGLKKKFIECATKLGRPEAVSEQVFGWLVQFSEYLFNLSHGIEYAMLSYRTAYAKIHFPTAFFKAKLENSDAKVDPFVEIKQLVNEAKLFNIKIVPPDIRRQNVSFSIVNPKSIAFGLATIKGVGESSLEALKNLKDIQTSKDFLKAAFDKEKKIKSNVVEALIKSGTVDCIDPRRIALLRKFKFLAELTPRERLVVLDGDHETIDDIHAAIMASKIPSKARRPKIDEAFELIKRDLGGNDKRMALGYEKFYLGMALSGSETDMYSNPKVDTTCRDFLRIRNNDRISLGVLIEQVRQIKDKNGNYMCFMQVSDSTYMLDGVVCFASVFAKLSWLIEEGRIVLLTGKKKDNSLLVDFIEHL